MRVGRSRSLSAHYSVPRQEKGIVDETVIFLIFLVL